MRSPGSCSRRSGSTPRKRAGKLSKGQQTALAQIVALAIRPAFLLLDEPASGLDPVPQRVVLDLLIDAASGGATILLIDLAAIVVAFLMLLVAGAVLYLAFATLVTFHIDGNGARTAQGAVRLRDLFMLQYDVPQMLTALAGGFGCMLMWYALVMLAAARLPGRGAMIAWLSWLVFLTLSGLWAVHFPPLIHGLIVALNYLNPLAYFGNHGSGVQQQLLALNEGLRTVLLGASASPRWPEPCGCGRPRRPDSDDDSRNALLARPGRMAFARADRHRRAARRAQAASDARETLRAPHRHSAPASQDPLISLSC
jgi:hypothetical protein